MNKEENKMKIKDFDNGLSWREMLYLSMSLFGVYFINRKCQNHVMAISHIPYHELNSLTFSHILFCKIYHCKLLLGWILHLKNTKHCIMLNCSFKTAGE